jgi:putative membrane protein
LTVLWLKAFHIVFVVTWFAALFYLPRLFIYHNDTRDEVGNARFKLMERKLVTVIMNPSAVLASVLGGLLLWNAWAAFGHAAWLWAKLALVLLLYGYHFSCLRIARELARDERRRSDRFLRIFNELPALVLISVVVLVVVKPGAA